MALATPTLIGSASGSATATFPAQVAGGALVVCARRANAGVFTNPAAVGYTNFVAEHSDDSSPDHSVIGLRECDGTETSVTVTNMAGGSRKIDVLYVAEPAGGGGDWTWPTVSDEHREWNTTTADDEIPISTDTTTGPTTTGVENVLIGSAMYATSVTAGDEGVWPAFWTRHTSDRFNGSSGSLRTNGAGHWTDTSVRFSWGGASTRRATLVVVAVEYVVPPAGPPVAGEFTSAALGLTASEAELFGGPSFAEFSPSGTLALTPSTLEYNQATEFVSAALVLDPTSMDIGLPRSDHGPPLETSVRQGLRSDSDLRTKDNGLSFVVVDANGASYVQTEDVGFSGTDVR